MHSLFRRCWAKAERSFTRFWSYQSLLKTPGTDLICPVYHICRETTPTWWNNRYRIKSPTELERDLDFLGSLGPFVSLQELLDWRRGKTDKPKGCFLSFDDGYRELYDTVAPLLQRKGIPATFFVISSVIDNQRMFHEDIAGEIHARLEKSAPALRHKAEELCRQSNTSLEGILRQRTPQWPILKQLAELVGFRSEEWLRQNETYLTLDQLRRLTSQGFGIGAHSIDHPLFSEISDEAREEQVVRSVAELSDRLGLPYRVFAFPYGEFGVTKSFLSTLKSSQQVDICFGTRGITEDELEPFLVQRMLAEDHPGTFPQHVHFELRLQRNRVLQQRGIVRRGA